jgi:Amt family ammonium transporter
MHRSVLSIATLILSILLAGWFFIDQTKISENLPGWFSQLGYLVFVLPLLIAFSLFGGKYKQHKSVDLVTEEEVPDNKKINSEKVLNTVSSCVIACDLNKNVLYINENGKRLVSCPEEGGVAISPCIINEILDIRDAQGRTVTNQVIDEQIKYEHRNFRVGQVQMISKNQGKRFVNLRTNPILSDDGVIEGVVLLLRDVTADRKVMNQLYRQASQDALTGLINRGSFEQFVEQVIHTTTEDNVGHVLAYIDLDHFKIINDSCGHAAGDELLRQVSQIFVRHIRQIDKVARIGGDEFAILLQGCPIDRAIEITEMILQDLRAFRFIWQEKNFVIGASIGIVEFNSGVGKSLKGLLTAADKACYMAKKMGRDQYFVLNLEKSTGSADVALLEWGKYLKDALRNDDFSLFAQPIVPLQSEHLGSIKQYEIFVRLPHDKNTFTPGSFMPEAERLGLTEDIDRWVIAKAIDSMVKNDLHQKFPHAGKGADSRYRLMINLSSQSVQNDKFADFICETITESRLSPALFCFEVSEPIAVAHFANAKRLFSRLRRFGCACSLDDFGSGFSSLSYLRELPVNYLKIDGGFVQNLASNDIDAAMVRAVNQVGRVMNLYSIAEAVEDKQTLQALREIGVDFAQGYYCGKPIPFTTLCQSVENEESGAMLVASGS